MTVADHDRGAEGVRPVEGPERPDQPADVEVRRNAGVLALVGGIALVLAVAYAVRAASGGAGVLWVLAAGLGAIAVVHLVAWADALAPVLVADDLGVRLRDGRRWRGLPWDEVASIDLEPQQGLRHDGRVVVHPADGGEALVLPVGLATAARAEDVVHRLEEVAHDRTRVTVTVRRPAPRPEPVEAAETQEAPVPTGLAATAAPEPEPAPDVPATTEDRPEPASAPVLASAPVQQGSAHQQEDEQQVAAPRRGTRVAAARQARRAVRAQVSRPGPRSFGGLALQGDDLAHDLPEAEVLRADGREELVFDRPTDTSTGVTLVPPSIVTGGNLGATGPAGAAPSSLAATPTTPVAPATPAAPAVDPVIGAQVRRARERLMLTVDGLAERTRIRPHVIESIEVDDFAPCGGDFYARGHLRSLARLLGLDAAELVATYDERYSHAPIEARRVFEAELATGPKASFRPTSGGPNWGALLGVVLVIAIIWGVATYLTGGGEPDAADPTTGDLAIPTAPPAADPPVVAPVATTSRLVLTGRATGTVTVSDADGEVLWRGELRRGETERVRAEGAVDVRVSAGGLVAAALDGDRRGTVGAEQGRTRTLRPEG